MFGINQKQNQNKPIKIQFYHSKPFYDPNMQGEQLTEEIFKKMTTDGQRFKINLYPSADRRWPAFKGKDTWKYVPQPNEIYYYVFKTDPYGRKQYFQGPTRTRNPVSGTYDVDGSFQTRWCIDRLTMELLVRNDMYSTEEYRVILEPYKRAWNQRCVDLTPTRDPRFSQTMNPTQFARMLRMVKDGEKQDTALLKRKHRNQQLRKKRSRTPSPTFFSPNKRCRVLAKTAMQRAWSKAKLTNPGKIVFILVGNNYFAFQEDANKLAKLTKLSLIDGAPYPTVGFAKDELDFYKACCFQKKLRVKVI